MVLRDEDWFQLHLVIPFILVYTQPMPMRFQLGTFHCPERLNCCKETIADDANMSPMLGGIIWILRPV